MRHFTLIRAVQFLNVLVYLAWYFASESRERFYFMFENFLVSWSALADGRVWTLLTSVFSHNLFFHLLINMYVLMGFGTALQDVLGSRRFLAFYLLAGISGSFAHAAVSAWILHEPGLPALGASGAIAGTLLLFSLLFPRERLLLLGLIPVRARWAAVLIIGVDLYGLWEQSRGGGLPIGHGAHLGGAVVGIFYYFILRANYSRSRRTGNRQTR